MVRTAILFAFILSVIGLHKCLLRFKTVRSCSVLLVTDIEF